MVTVTTDEICAAMKHAFEDTRTLLEPAGALAIAGVEKYDAPHPRPFERPQTMRGQNLAPSVLGWFDQPRTPRRVWLPG